MRSGPVWRDSGATRKFKGFSRRFRLRVYFWNCWIGRRAIAQTSGQDPWGICTILAGIGLDTSWLGVTACVNLAGVQASRSTPRASLKRASACGQGWLCTERNSASALFRTKRLAFIADTEIRGVAEDHAARRSACFQETCGWVDGAKQESTAGKSQRAVRSATPRKPTAANLGGPWYVP